MAAIQAGRGVAMATSVRQDKRSGRAASIDAILSGEATGFGYDRLRDFLKGASELYGAGLQMYLAAEQWRLRKRVILPVPVISIGNLSVGGTGKTPMTQLIARLLCSEGWHPAILSRGYRGSLRGRNRPVSDRDGQILLTAQEAGDEPSILARTLPGVPVVVGKDRRVSGRLAIRSFQPDVIILDDGFQYWQLARDLDIVLLDARQPFENGFALPRGLLREPKENLARAGMIVLTRAQGLTSEERSDRLAAIREIAPSVRVFWARHAPGSLRPLNDAARRQQPGAVIALCGIAQPDSFLRSVRESGLEIVGEPIAYPDHQKYETPQMHTILGKMKDYPEAALVTTEKDAAKLDARSFPAPSYALDVHVEVEDAAAFRASIGEVLLKSSSASER